MNVGRFTTAAAQAQKENPTGVSRREAWTYIGQGLLFIPLLFINLYASHLPEGGLLRWGTILTILIMAAFVKKAAGPQGVRPRGWKNFQILTWIWLIIVFVVVGVALQFKVDFTWLMALVASCVIGGTYAGLGGWMLKKADHGTC